MQGNNIYCYSVYAFCKIVTQGKESQDFSVKNWASHTKTHERVELMLHAVLSLTTDGGELLASQTAT
jgi:hypothetical protein